QRPRPPRCTFLPYTTLFRSLTGASLRHILLLDRTRALLSAAARGGCYLERGIGAKALATATPRVVAIGAGLAASVGPPIESATTLEVAAAAEVAAATSKVSASATEVPTATAGAGDLCGGVPHGRANLINLELHHGAAFTLTGLEGPLHEPALNDDPHPLGEGFGNVLGGVAPDRAAQEESFPIPPL